MIAELMAVALEGEPDASQRERDAVRRALEVLEDAGYVLQHESVAAVTRDAGVSHLPAPRLQLRWSSPHLCHYELVIPLGKYDVRRERGNGDTRSCFMAIPLNSTRVGGGNDIMFELAPDGTARVRMPYRDGMHIRWDAHTLKLPAYAIWGDHVTPIEPLAPRLDTTACPAPSPSPPTPATTSASPAEAAPAPADTSAPA